MNKELKLFFVNYKFMVDKYGEDLQKRIHKKCFELVLKSVHSGNYPITIPASGDDYEGTLNLVEVSDTETHKVAKYFFRAV